MNHTKQLYRKYGGNNNIDPKCGCEPGVPGIICKKHTRQAMEASQQFDKKRSLRKCPNSYEGEEMYCCRCIMPIRPKDWDLISRQKVTESIDY